MRRIWFAIFFVLFFSSTPSLGLELQGFLTKDCQRHTGLTVHVQDEKIDFINLEGQFESIAEKDVLTLYVFDVIENPFTSIKIDERGLAFLKSVYLENSNEPRAYAFPVRFVEDLVIFYSLDGKTHVQTYADIYKLRPAPKGLLGTHPTHSPKQTQLAFTDESSHCQFQDKKDAVKPTRILADQIAIDEFLNSFEQGYERLESFEERTYLYPRPFLFKKRTRLGLVFQGAREEPNLNVPLYFQWSTGEPYRFQSMTSIGLKSHEVTPNTEPVWSIRSDVKSHVFHAMFVGNVLGLPAGNSTFLKSNVLKLQDDFQVEPSFNYMALMGGDFGPYSLSFGFYYPTFAFKIKNEYREILGSSLSYAIRGMYTNSRVRLRAIGSIVKYNEGYAGQNDVLSKTGDTGNLGNPQSFEFSSYFVRPGIDYDWTDTLSTGADLTFINGNYKETLSSMNNNMKFNKITAQAYVQRTFGQYVAISFFVNLIEKNYESNFLNKTLKENKQETVFFGSLEFMF